MKQTLTIYFGPPESPTTEHKQIDIDVTEVECAVCRTDTAPVPLAGMQFAANGQSLEIKYGKRPKGWASILPPGLRNHPTSQPLMICPECWREIEGEFHIMSEQEDE